MNRAEEKPVDSLIESAMKRIKQSGELVDPATRTGIGRRDYDQALAKRLALLAQSGHASDSLQAVPAQTPQQHQAPHHHPAAMLLTTAIVSALFGATLMWLAIGNKPRALSLPDATTVRAPAPVGVTTPSAADAPTPAASPTMPAGSPPAPAVSTAAAQAATAPPAPSLSLEQEIATMLEAWRNAWANRDPEAYLSFYSPDFAPADGQKRSTWAESRRKNLTSRPSIDVAIHDLEIERMGEGLAKARFHQDYAAGKIRETGQPKTLLLVREQGDWLIAGEWQGKEMAAQAGR